MACPVLRFPSLRALVLLAGLAWPTSAHSDGLAYREVVTARSVPRWFVLPFELGGSAAWVDDRQGPVYRLGVGVLPGMEFSDWFAANAVIGGLYRNPDFDVQLGVRGNLLLGRLAGGYAPMHLLAEVVSLPISEAAMFSGGLMIGAGRLLRLAALASYDTDRESISLGMRFGLELTGLANPAAALTHYTPYEEVPRGQP
jgi:hypothetical protein